MRNLKMTIEYDGTDFYGWQYQPDRRTVQGEIEGVLREITGGDIRIIGAGRTDQGVHAIGQIANFKTDTDIPNDRLKIAINSLIGKDVYIKDISEVPLDFNARFSARSKVYQYRIMTQFSPFKKRYYWFVDYRLNLQSMRLTMQNMLGQHDYRYLSVLDNEDLLGGKKNTLCAIYNLSLTESNNDIIIEIEADRFLRRMVRGITGFLVDVGRGRFQPDDVERIYSGGLNGIFFAPPCGLYLLEVRY